jgi:hypothetical protein
MIGFLILNMFVLALFEKISDAESFTLTEHNSIQVEQHTFKPTRLKEIFFNKTAQSYQIRIDPSVNIFAQETSKKFVLLQ